MRADKFFAERFGSRTKAAEALAKGFVRRGGKQLKPSDEICETDSFVLIEEAEQFVSNGGYKLSRALSAFSEGVQGKTYADIGASTGGFTDCLLQNGAKHVFCVDVGESLLDPKVKNDDRVTVMDRTNARYLTKESFSRPLDGVVSDVSFISLKLILPAVSALLPDDGKAFVLIKPQFEAGREKIGKGGIVPKKFHGQVLREIYDCANSLSLAPINVVNAPLREKKNIEYVALLQKNGTPISQEAFVSRAESLK